MRITSASRTGPTPQSLGRYDTSVSSTAVATSGGRNMALDVAREVGAGLGQLAQSMARVEDIKADRQYQQSNLFMQKSDNEFWEAIGGREFLDVDEIPHEFRTEGMEVKGRVLAAEVVPQMYEAHVQSQLTEAAKIIDNKKLRSDWEVRARDTAVQRQTRIQTEANNAIEGQIFKDQVTNFENAIDNDRPDLALQIAQDMNGPPEQVEKFKRIARKSGETTTYEAVIIAEDEAGIDRAIEYLSQDPPDYRDEGGELNREERISWIQKLRREKDRMTRARGAVDKAQLNLLKRQLRITESNSLKGKQTDPQELLELRARAVALDDGSLTDDIADLDASIVYTTLVNSMNLLDGPGRRAFLDSVEELDIPDYEKDQLLLRLEATNQEFTNGIRTDMMRTAADAGYMELIPLSVEADLNDPESMQQLMGQLQLRLSQYHEAEANYGDGQGPLTKEEASALSTQVNNLSAEGKQGFLGSVAAVLGEDSEQFFNQMSLNGADKSLAVAGMATANGRPDVSKSILRGSDYRRENPEEVKTLTKLLNIRIEKELGTAYRNNPAYRASLKQAIVDGYIGMALIAGEDLSTINDGGWFSSGTFTDAMQGVTGGLVRQNREVIAPPSYGTTQRQWNSWINSIGPEYIDNLGGVAGLESRAVIDEIRSGDILVKDTGKMGEYVLTSSNGVPLQNVLTGGAFILTYDPKAPLDTQKLDMYGNPLSEEQIKAYAALDEASAASVAARERRSQERVEQRRIYLLRQELGRKHEEERREQKRLRRAERRAEREAKRGN
ncbi:MAG: hypothetical protein ACWGQW_05370 [bacterium]